MSFLPCPVAFMSMGLGELVLLAVVALLVFGGNLPDVMRELGRSYAKLRRSLHELSRPVREEIRHVRDLPSARDLGSVAREHPETGEDTAEDAGEEPPAATPAAVPEEGGAQGAADEPPPV
jgi:sec-independent protein translocase protein TatA